MDKLDVFFTIIAWPIGIGATLLFIARVLAIWTYTELDKALDGLKGVRKTFPLTKPFITAIACWTWIIV